MWAERWARIWFALTAAIGIAALVTEFVMSATYTANPVFTTPAGRVINELFYFTILSNVLVAVTTLLLAIPLDRPSRAFRGFRLSALTGIVITAVVYHAILASLSHLGGMWLVTNHAMHTVVPIMAIAGWLAFGPRGLTGWRTALLSLLFPGFYLVVTLVRGPII